jgi:copper chaperone
MSETIQLRVMDFDCPSCASTVEHSLANTEGVQAVEVYYTTGRVEVTYDDSVVASSAFEETIRSQGYTPQPA